MANEDDYPFDKLPDPLVTAALNDVARPLDLKVRPQQESVVRVEATYAGWSDPPSHEIVRWIGPLRTIIQCCVATSQRPTYERSSQRTRVVPSGPSNDRDSCGPQAGPGGVGTPVRCLGH